MALTPVLGGGLRSAAGPALTGATLALLSSLALWAPQLRSAFVGATLLGLLAWAARRHARPALVVGVTAIGVLPVYAGRYVAGTQFGLTPALLVLLVLTPLALEQAPRWRLVPMDVAVASLVVLRLGSTLLNFDNKLGAGFGPAIYLVASYAVFRLLLLRAGVLQALTRVVVVVAVGCSAFAVFEHAGFGNVFFRLPSVGYVYKDFAHAQLRFGEVRAEASFGHSIALGMFLGLAAVLAVALAVGARSTVGRAGWTLSVGLIVVGTLDTLSRGALLALGVGLGLWFLRESGRLRLPAVVAAIAATGAIFVLTPVSTTVGNLVSSSNDSTSVESASTEHRFAILDLVSDPEQFTLLGHKSSGSGGVTDQLEQRTRLGSFDNAYALVYLANGLLPVLAFLSVGALAFLTFAASGLTPFERAWTAGLCAAALNLFTVNLLTQFGDFFWMAAAVTAVTWQRLLEDRDARTAAMSGLVR